METKKYLKECIVCGNFFNVEVDKKTRKILTPCFYSPMRKYHFFKWSYPHYDGIWEDWKLPWYKKLFKKEQVHYTNNSKLWKILGYTKFQRWIIYNTWRLFFGWQKLEYWECTQCYYEGEERSSDDTYTKKDGVSVVAAKKVKAVSKAKKPVKAKGKKKK